MRSMRPTVGETLRSIRKILTEEILPEVSSEYAKRLGGEIVGDLALLERWWEKAIPNLAEQNGDLRSLFTDSLIALEGAQARQGSPVLRELESQIRLELEHSYDLEEYLSYQALERTNRRYEVLLEHAIVALEAIKDTHGDNAGLQQLRQKIRGHLRKYLDREIALRDIDITAWRTA